MVIAFADLRVSFSPSSRPNPSQPLFHMGGPRTLTDARSVAKFLPYAKW